MVQYLLSTYTEEDDGSASPMTSEEMQTFMERVVTLESEMEATGTFVFGGALHGPDVATVVRMGDADLVTTDGPFAESKEHIGGFYIINAEDLDAALAWAGKVVDAIKHPISAPISADRAPAGVTKYGLRRWRWDQRRVRLP